MLCDGTIPGPWSGGDQMRQSRAVTSQPAPAAHHRTPARLTYFGISGPQTTWSTPTPPYIGYTGFLKMFEEIYRGFLNFSIFTVNFCHLNVTNLN